MAEPEPLLRLLRSHAAGVRHMFIGHIHLPLTGSWPGGLAFTAGRGCSHQMVLDLEAGDAPWVAGVPNYNVIIAGEDDLFVHAFDLIDADGIGTARAPKGP